MMSESEKRVNQEVVPDKVEAVVARGPREKDATISVRVKKEEDSLNFSKDTLFYFLYLMYKSNMVSRVNLKQMFRVVDEEMPKNVVKYLLEEAARG